MSIWYVAPDATTVPGVTPIAIAAADPAYGTSWGKAAKWSEFVTAGGIIASKLTNNDTIVFLGAEYKLTDISGGLWTPINWSFTGVKFWGRFFDMTLGPAVFKGTRDWPWPAGGDPSAGSLGETFMRLVGVGSAPYMSGCHFRNMLFSVTPASNGDSRILGTLTQDDCGAMNVAGALVYTSTRQDGRLNIVQNRCVAHGYAKGNARVWGSFQHTDCIMDSEFHADDKNASLATPTSAANSKDAQPGITVTTYPSSSTRCIYKNHMAGIVDVAKVVTLNSATAITFSVQTFTGGTQSTGSITVAQTDAQIAAAIAAVSNVGKDLVTVTHTGSGSTLKWQITFDQSLGNVIFAVTASTGGTGPTLKVDTNYAQGDGVIGEEDVGVYSAREVLTYNNGDRGIDMKCNGTVVRHITWGDGTAGVGHHLDTGALRLVQCIERTGSRPYGATTTAGALQVSGIINAFQSVVLARASTLQVNNNKYALGFGSMDASNWQAGIYGAVRVGLLTLQDCWGSYQSSNGVLEQVGFGVPNADSARFGAVFGLTPSTAYNFAVRALAQDGSASAWSADQAYTTAAAGGGGDTTGPVAPTGFAIVGASSGAGTSGSPYVLPTSNSVTVSWTQNTPDAGTFFQGYVFALQMPGDSAPILMLPGKANAPATFTGLKPATTYQIQVACYDVTMNLGTFTTSLYFTTAAGSTNTSTPGVPGGWQIAVSGPGSTATIPPNPTSAGFQWSLPGTGTVAYYELATHSGGTYTVVARMFPMPGSAGTPVYTKSNCNIVTV